MNAGSLPVCGSPPRTRGGGPHRRPHLRERGITPAYAGRRRRGRWGAGSVADHPRVRGEESADARRYPLGVGSPPRTRGGGPRGEKLPLGGRITPAYAGRSRPRSAMSPPARDHPRVRGEEITYPRDVRSGEGSPPRTRGGAPPPPTSEQHQRITPAYAGRSSPDSPGRPSTPDHPRVRGEEIRAAVRVLLSNGSPPRTRGGARVGHGPDRGRRITPAYAGRRRYGIS